MREAVRVLLAVVGLVLLERVAVVWEVGAGPFVEREVKFVRRLRERRAQRPERASVECAAERENREWLDARRPVL